MGLFPGVIFDPAIPEPPNPKLSLRPYLRRHDGYWLDYEKELPFPMPSPGHNYEDVYNEFQRQLDKRGITNEVLVQVPP